MRIVRVLSLTACGVVLGWTAAGAQEQSNLGITMGYPAAVGLLWHVTDTMAIRPDFRISGSSSEPLESDSWTFATGVSALFYRRAADNVRTYLAPRVEYQRGSSTTEGFAGQDARRIANAWGVAGSFGAEYTPNRRFGVFGEVGFAYSRLKTGASLFTPETTGHGWGTRAGVGVIFYPGS
jgi:hypothetical protein